MTLAVLLIPLLFVPFLISLLVKKTHLRRKYTYLFMVLSVPFWPLILTLAHFLSKDGFVLVGTSVFVMPIALFLQYLANKFVFEKTSNAEVSDHQNKSV